MDNDLVKTVDAIREVAGMCTDVYSQLLVVDSIYERMFKELWSISPTRESVVYPL